jgi:hypothetical protein
MMTGHHPRGHIPRHTHQKSNNRAAMGDNPIYYLGGLILSILLLSVLSQKTLTNNGTGINVTTHGNHPFQPDTNSLTKYSNPTRIGSDCNLSTSQPTRKQVQTNHSRAVLHSSQVQTILNRKPIRQMFAYPNSAIGFIQTHFY